MAKVIFLHLSVILFIGGGGSASMHAGIPPPWEQTPPPRTRCPPRPCTPPLGADTPGPYSPPRSRHPPPDQAPSPWNRPPRADTPTPTPPRPAPPPPPPGSRLQHTVYERPVRILLECILVYILFIYIDQCINLGAILIHRFYQYGYF